MISFRTLLVGASAAALVGCGDASMPMREAPRAAAATRTTTPMAVDDPDELPATLPARTAVGNLPCADVVLCQGFCSPADRACAARCDSLASTAAIALARALSRCVEEAGCGGEDACAQDRCAPQIAACVGDVHRRW